MKTTIALSTAALMALAAPAFANAHTQGLESSGNAKAMVENIKTFGADIAPTVSGKNASGPGDSGWGNAGSRVTPTLPGGTAGGQVSKRGNNDD